MKFAIHRNWWKRKAVWFNWFFLLGNRSHFSSCELALILQVQVHAHLVTT